MAETRRHRLDYELTATDHASRAIREVTGAVRGLHGAFAALSGVAGVGALAVFVQDAIRYRSALDDLADTTGDNVRTLDALARQARVSGFSIEQLEGFLTKLAYNLHNTDDDGKAAARALEAIGLSADDLRAKKPGEAIMEIARALDRFEDGAGKVAAARALMGREGAKALPLLKDLAEAGELQGRITAEQAAQAERLEKQWRKLIQALQDGKQELLSGIIPDLADWIEANREAIRIAGSLTEALRLFVFNLDAMTTEKPRQQIERLTEALRRYREAGPVGRFIQSPTGFLFGGREEDLKKQIEFLQFLERQGALRDRTGAEFLDARDLMARQKETLDFRPPPGGGPAAAGPDLFAQLKQQLEAETIRVQELSRQQEMLLVLETERYRTLSPAKKSELVMLAGKVDLLKAEQKYTKELADEQKRIEETLQRIREEELARLKTLAERSEIEYMIAQHERLLERDDLLRETRMREIREQRQREEEEARRLADAARELGLTFSSAFEDAIAGGRRLSEVLRGLAQDVARIFVRKTVTEPVALMMSDWAKSFGLGRLLGFQHGGSFEVGGAGGADSQVVMFRATPGETVTVSPPGSGTGGVIINVVNNSGAEARVGERRGVRGERIVDVLIEHVTGAIGRNLARGEGLAPLIERRYGLSPAAGALR